jgi:hypothetical protein
MKKNRKKSPRFHADLNTFRNAWMHGFIGNTIIVVYEYVCSAEKNSRGPNTTPSICR